MHRSLSGQPWKDLKTNPRSLELFLKEFDSKAILFSSEEMIAEIREEIQKKEQEAEEKKEKKTTSDIVVVHEKIKKRNEKFLKAIKAGARLAEISCSKLLWDKGHNRLKVTQGKLDYRALQVLDCAADLIAQEHWLASAFDPSIEANMKEPDHLFVPISYQQFIHFIEDKGKLSTKEVMRIFEKMPKIILKGPIKIPYAKNQWLNLEAYEDNICGMVYAWDKKESFGEYRSKRRMRDRAGKEEPVFILVFSNPYGKAFFHNAMNREGTQLQNPRLYHLKPEAQMLFQAIRWKDIFKSQRIEMNTEQASQMMGLTWPVSKTGLYKRVALIREVLRILKDENFIHYRDKSYEIGKTIKTKAWRFHIIRKWGYIRSLVKK